MPTGYAVINRSSRATDADCLTMFVASELQLRRHVAPAWERRFSGGTFVGLHEPVPTDKRPVYVLDSPDIAGMLGYHAEDPEGRPYGRVFVDAVTAHGGGMLRGSMSVSTILSHEVIELFLDPTCQLWADRGDGRTVAYEACDPVESEHYDVRVRCSAGGSTLVSVSNFVLGAWFDPGKHPDGTKFDWLGTRKAPFVVAPGGYAIVRDISGRTLTTFGSREHEVIHAARRPTVRSACRCRGSSGQERSCPSSCAQQLPDEVIVSR